jgi:hypothetical protein
LAAEEAERLEKAAIEAEFGQGFRNHGTKGKVAPLTSTSGTSYGPSPIVPPPTAKLPQQARRSKQEIIDEITAPQKELFQKTLDELRRKRLASTTRPESVAESVSGEAVPPPSSQGTKRSREKDNSVAPVRRSVRIKEKNLAQNQEASTNEAEIAAENVSAEAAPWLPLPGTKRSHEEDGSEAPERAHKRLKMTTGDPAQNQEASTSRAENTAESVPAEPDMEVMFADVSWGQPTSEADHRAQNPDFVAWLEEPNAWSSHICHREKDGFKLMSSERGGRIFYWKYCIATGGMAMAVERE